MSTFSRDRQSLSGHEERPTIPGHSRSQGSMMDFGSNSFMQDLLNNSDASYNNLPDDGIDKATFLQKAGIAYDKVDQSYDAAITKVLSIAREYYDAYTHFDETLNAASQPPGSSLLAEVLFGAFTAAAGGFVGGAAAEWFKKIKSVKEASDKNPIFMAGTSDGFKDLTKWAVRTGLSTIPNGGIAYETSSVALTPELFRLESEIAIGKERDFLQAVVLDWQLQTDQLPAEATFVKDPLKKLEEILPLGDAIFNGAGIPGETAVEIEEQLWSSWISRFGYDIQRMGYSTRLGYDQYKLIERAESGPIWNRLVELTGSDNNAEALIEAAGGDLKAQKLAEIERREEASMNSNQSSGGSGGRSGGRGSSGGRGGR